MAVSKRALFELAHPDISIKEQYLALHAYCNGDARITNHDRTVVWEGVLQPTPVSPFYSVTVSYTMGQSPKCVVTNPFLNDIADGKKIPHTYVNDTRINGTQLCLYLPYISGKNKISEWNSKLLLVETIIPWASLWLFYFEDWLASGEWQGGGVEHASEGS